MNIDNTIRESVIYIETNLQEPLTAEFLAKRVYLSEYYFCRQFKNVTGLTVMKYIQNRRLSERFYVWAKEGKIISLEQVAGELGYSSHATLTRSFKNTFGITPKAYYNSFIDGHLDQLYPPYKFWGKKIGADEEGFLRTEHYSVVTLEPIILIGASIKTSLMAMENFDKVKEISKRVYKEINSIEHLKESVKVESGVAFNCRPDYYQPDNVSFEYFRGFEVSKISFIPKGFGVFKIPEKTYLKFETTSDEGRYEKTLDYIFGHVLVPSQLSYYEKNIALFERVYPKDDAHPFKRAFNIDLYIPINPDWFKEKTVKRIDENCNEYGEINQ